MDTTRAEIAALITKKLEEKKHDLKNQFSESKNQIGYFFIDDLLPQNLAETIHKCFPKLEDSVSKKSIKEYKYVAYQMNLYHPILEEVIYAFQEPIVVKLIQEICDLKDIFPDKHLYAGGLSLMNKNNFLSPHIDNSHDKDRNQWRVLNLLYYVTPNWGSANGGNLELWPDGLKSDPLSLQSKFNRLIVMSTHKNSWHSVNKINTNEIRCCVSNYYFSKTPLLPTDKFHITSFRGRPGQKFKDMILRIDNTIRTGIRKIFKKGIRENPHKYKK